MSEITILSDYKIKKAEGILRKAICPGCEKSTFELFNDGRVFCSKCKVQIEAYIEIKTYDD